MSAPQRILVGGGVRSGKSAFALRRARALGETRVFIATAQAFDGEMKERIAAHQEERGDTFTTVECPLALPETLASVHNADVVLVDCLTLWLSNMLLANMGESRITERVRALEETLRAAAFHSIVVTNEVGMGVVPESALGRLFRDVSGRTHQVLARGATEVYLAALGMVLRLRPGPVEVIGTGLMEVVGPGAGS